MVTTTFGQSLIRAYKNYLKTDKLKTSAAGPVPMLCHWAPSPCSSSSARLSQPNPKATGDRRLCGGGRCVSAWAQLSKPALGPARVSPRPQESPHAAGPARPRTARRADRGGSRRGLRRRLPGWHGRRRCSGGSSAPRWPRRKPPGTGRPRPGGYREGRPRAARGRYGSGRLPGLRGAPSARGRAVVGPP